jgi:hypothetical protein
MRKKLSFWVLCLSLALPLTQVVGVFASKLLDCCDEQAKILMDSTASTDCHKMEMEIEEHADINSCDLSDCQFVHSPVSTALANPNQYFFLVKTQAYIYHSISDYSFQPSSLLRPPISV